MIYLALPLYHMSGSLLGIVGCLGIGQSPYLVLLIPPAKGVSLGVCTESFRVERAEREAGPLSRSSGYS